MALSSTEAIPSITSPSAAIASPASTRKASPFLSAVEGTDSNAAPWCGSFSRFAGVSRLARRSPSACAFPRPSASASEKFAKRTVNQSQRDTNPIYQAGASPWPARAWIQRAVVSTLPTSTTNMTGLRIIERGFSFKSASRNARRYISPVKPRGFFSAEVSAVIPHSLVDHHEMLNDRPEGERRQEIESSHDQHYGDEPEDEKGRVRRECSFTRRNKLLSGQ